MWVGEARILEWVAIPFSRRSSWPRDWTQVSHIVGRHFTVWATNLSNHQKNEWIKKMWYIYIVEYSSAMKRMKYTICSNMDGPEIIIWSEVSQTEKDKYHIILLVCESKIWHKWTYLQKTNRLTDIEDWLVGEEVREGTTACDKLYWRRTLKRSHITESLCWTAEINTAL